MARKRMIDADMWSDPKFLRLKSPFKKLLFVGLISIADDEGLGEADGYSLKVRLGLVESSVEDLEKALKELSQGEKPLVELYQHSGITYYFLPNFLKHQNMNYFTPTKFIRPPERILKKYPQHCKKIIHIAEKYSGKNSELIQDLIRTYSVLNQDLEETEKDLKNSVQDLSLGKDRLGKVYNNKYPNGYLSPKSNLETSNPSQSNNSNSEPEKIPKCPVNRILEIYHSKCSTLKKVKQLSNNDKKILRTRWREHPELEFWESFFQRVSESEFLMGRKTDWQADFQWLIRPTNFSKVLNGRYENRNNGENGLNLGLGENKEVEADKNEIPF